MDRIGRALACLALLLGGYAADAGAETVVYYHTDALGSPAAVTDANRNVIERTQYAPYGDTINRQLHDGPGYTGHETDAATGLVYAQQRYYDPALGRFLSADPVAADAATGGNFNRFRYADDNPYRYTDPDGRCTGSHIENSDGSCLSSGGYTTASTARSSGVLVARSGERSNQHREIQGRKLTQGEVEAAKSELPHLDTEPVRVSYDLRGKTAWTPNNTMHFPKKMESCQDFSTCDKGIFIGWFIHEITHVYQYQNGRDPTMGHIFSSSFFSRGNYLSLKSFLKTPSPSGLNTEKEADWHMWHYVCAHGQEDGC